MAGRQQLHSQPCDSRPHVFAISLPAQGHVNSMIRLCRMLASEHFTVTFVYADVLHERIQDDTAVLVPEEGHSVDIRMMGIPFPGIDLTNAFKIYQADFVAAIGKMGDAFGQVVQDLCREGHAIDLILYDICMTDCVQEVADKYNLPMVCLNPFSLSFYLYFLAVCQGRIPLINDAAIHGAIGPNDHLLSGVPGLPSLRYGDIPKFKLLVDETEIMYPFFARQIDNTTKKAKALFVNTFCGVEGSAIDAVSKEIPVYAVGLFLDRMDEGSSISLWSEQNDCIQWLDEQPPHSVMYISFGSVSLMSVLQFQELLLGLEASLQRFLWAFRPGLVEDYSYSSLADNLLERTRDRSYIVSWAPQLRVLSHASVGGFLTHCGWNSTMESVAMGVPVLCMPNLADQFINSKLAVDEWGTGLKFEAGEGGVVRRDEVERAVRQLMHGDEARTSAARLRVRSAEAASTHGTAIRVFRGNIMTPRV